MTPNELYTQIFNQFPAVIEPTNQECQKIYGENLSITDHPYRWFEILANIINDELQRFIDVAFIENLFWNVKKEQAKIYWKKFPPVLQDLYEDFHWKKPYE